MTNHRGTETGFELTTIDRIQRQGYGYQFGPELEHEPDAVVLGDRLRAFLARRCPALPTAVQAK